MKVKRLLVFVILYSVAASASASSRIISRDGLLYVWAKAGNFDFGCSTGDHLCFAWEKVSRPVFVQGFWIGATEVTQAAYEKVTGSNPSLYKGGNLPVDRVSWNEAHKYCETVGLRLPTEVEWEYAARGGARSGAYRHLDDIAWYDGNSSDRTHPVAQESPNGFGLYDMLGNVWEWVQDRYEVEVNMRILRGGSFYNVSRELRFSNRLWATPETAHRNMGFRCVGSWRLPPSSSLGLQ